MNKYYGMSRKELRELGISTDKANSRNSWADRKWKAMVHKRDNDTCLCCGKENLSPKYAHHLESYRNNEELRYVLDNGVTLCKECHFEFHKAYGLKNNTRKQFEEYLKNREAK